MRLRSSYRPHVRVLAVCLLAFAAAACEGLQSASQGSRPSTARVPRQAPAYERTITIEFDQPPEFLAKDATGRLLTVAFQVGFFDGPRLVRAIEIARESARVSGNKILLTVPLSPVASSRDSSVAIRLRLLSVGALGEWSQPAGSVTLPVAERVGRPSGGTRRSELRDRPEPRPRQSRARTLTTAQLERHPRLQTALKEVLDGTTIDDAVGSFSNPQDLATAVVLSSKLGLPFAKLSQAVRASPRRSVEEGLRSLRPAGDAAAEVRAVAGEAKALLGNRPRR